MRKIWEQTNVSKFNNGPEISETSTICAKAMGGQVMPTLLGPTNSAGYYRLEISNVQLRHRDVVPN